ncbi:MAG TPA: hypothetical protein VL966_13905 [Alphaproteobacteria bacterium]|jgi:hypothetical protein|nr:hypothetical protein [Alphaproteobacteria bacterium]
MKRWLTMVGTVGLLASLAVSVTACGNYQNYKSSHSQQSILDGPDRSNDWWKTNDDGK